MDPREHVRQLGRQAREASRALARAGTQQKNRALHAIAGEIRSRRDAILDANRADVADAKGNDAAFVDRLTLTPKLVEQMAEGVEEVAKLSDPVGAISERVKRPTGIEVARMRVPLGVIAIIYESRPNVTADAASLCLKSGNAVILRGGSEAVRSNVAIVAVLRRALETAGLPAAAITFLDNPDRAAAALLLKQDRLVDVVIPRGGEGLMEFVARESTIPVIKHDKGVCHTYVDEGADLAMAEAICFNAKVQRPGTCNAMETLLVHAAEAEAFLPRIGA